MASQELINWLKTDTHNEKMVFDEILVIGDIYIYFKYL